MNPAGPDRTRVLVLGLLDALLASWWTVVVGLTLGLAGALVVLDRTDKIYDAYTVVDIDVDAMPDYFVTKTIAEEDARMIHSLLQDVLYSEELENEIRSLEASTGDSRSQVELLTRARSRISLAFFDINRPLEIHYFDADPVVAAGVANAVTRQFVEKTASSRSGTARENVETMQRLADDVKQDLIDHQALVSAYRSEHIDELPERMSEIESSLSQKRADLSANQEQQLSLQSRIQTLEAQSAAETTDVVRLPGDDDVEGGVTSGAQGGSELVGLYATRDELLRRYQKSHPEVLRIQALIDELESQSPRSPESPEESDPKADSPAVAAPAFGVWDLQRRAAQAKLRKLETEEQQLRREISRLERQLRNIPQVQQELDRLSWGLAAKQREFDQLQAKVLTAKSGERLENIEGDRRFAISALAAVPSVPVSPKPAVLLLGGCVIGLAVFVGPVLARRYLAPKIGSEAGIRTLVDLPVLGRIPSIATVANRRKRRVRVLKNIALAGSGALILGLVVTLQMVGLL